MAELVPTLLVILLSAGLLGFVQSALPERDRALIWLAFLSHVPAAIAMVVITRNVLGGGDLLNYHRVGSAIAERMSDEFGTISSNLVQVMAHQIVPLPVPAHGIGSATGAMYALSSFLALFTGQSIYAVCTLIGFATFFSSLAMYLAIRDELPEASARRLMLACFFIPSVVFWSSALLKEAIVMSGICALVVGGQWIGRHQRFVSGGATMLIGAAIVAMLKAYILVPFGIAAGLWFYMVALRKEGAPHIKAVNVLAGTALAVALVAGTGALFPQYSFDAFAEETAHHQEVGSRWSGDADYVLANEAGVEEGLDGLQGQAQVAPLALFTALFRPLIFEAGNAQMVVNSLETTGIFLLALVALYRSGFRGFVRSVSTTPFLAFCVVFVFGMALGVGLATTNLGTLSRYRMPLMPFFAILLLELASQRRAVAVAPQAAAVGYR